MLKMLGIGMVIATSSAIGFSMSKDLEKRVVQLTELKRMFVMLQGEIKYGKTPLAEGFGKVGQRSGPLFQGFLQYLSEDMEKRDGRSLSRIFEEGVDLKLEHCYLAKEDLEQLKTVGSHLGYLDIDMQLRNIDLYLEQLNENCIQARQNYQNKSRVYHCLGVMGGLFLAIILI